MKYCLPLLGIALLLLAGCSRSMKPVPLVTIEPRVSPQPAFVGPVTIDFALKDASGIPITGAHAALEANMSHAGMTPVFAEAKEIAPGDYRCQIDFSMAGDWVVNVRVSLPDGQQLERQFEVRGVRPVESVVH